MDYKDSSKHEPHTAKPKWRIELVDVNKFIILFVMSLGLYAIWWMYKSWKFFQEREQPDMIPAARAIFGIFWLYPLFERIRLFADENGYHSSYYSILLFLGFLFTNISANIPGPIGLVSIFAFVFLIPPVRALNFAIMNSDDYDGQEVDQYNAGQMIIVAFGIVTWSMVMLGLMSSGNV